MAAGVGLVGLPLTVAAGLTGVDMVKRRGVAKEDVERWLAPNLG